MPTAASPVRQPALRALPMLLCVACLAAADLGDYEYFYDELPREHLAPLTRLGRAEHVQHVPAAAPRAAAADGARTAVQRVPRMAPPPLPDGEPRRAQERQEQPGPAAELQPPPRVEGAAEDAVQAGQAPPVPAAVPDELTKEDMETANFFWGLGPVYPHLYVYQRVPHLVPLHGWNPYHAYVLTHPSR